MNLNSLLRRLRTGPAEGWTSPIFVTLLVLTAAWAIDDATWVLGRDQYTDFLALTVVWSVAVGFVGAKLGWGRWPTFIVGALLAAIVVPLYVGAVVAPNADWFGQYQATATSVVEAYRDLALRDRVVTQQFGHFLLVLGLFTWATGLFASYATFGHHRPLNAIILVGLVLVGNMSLTYNNQLNFLVVFSLAALFLLIRFHAFDEETEWIRRRIGDPASVSRIYLRGGSIFIAVAVVGSIVLTQTASSAPLAGALRGIGDSVVDWGRDLQRFLPTGGTNRGFGVSFGSTAPITGNWATDGSLAATIEFGQREEEPLYWRAVTYDTFDFNAWRKSEGPLIERGPGQELLAGTPEAVTAEGTREVIFKVFPDGFRDAAILSPKTPVTSDRGVRLDLVGEGGYFGTTERIGDGAYTIRARVPLTGDTVPGGLTGNKLRVAGTDYPENVRAVYLEVPDGVIPEGGAAEALLARIIDEAGNPTNPYDLAVAMEAYLKSGRNFSYQTDVRTPACDNLSTVECFATIREGYCQYYATTMAMLLREAGVPTRLAQGFLPGARNGTTERLYFNGAHAWVEVYFPGYGWVDFDPTGGGVARNTPLPPGEPVASAAPNSSAGPLPTLRRPGGELEEDFGAEGDALGSTGRPGGVESAGPLIAVALLLLLIIGGFALLAWQRGPRGEINPDRAYSTLTRLAGRLGFGPRPTQTVYEYAGELGHVLPQSRPEIQTVADAKVEFAYGRRAFGSERIAALREAQRRLQLGLLRLVLRRGPWRSKR
ncbi:MAG TPA: transglutaminaseTgpA domain-containing protein [Clostridia bacterium]|nr:transglutaminaseTgpA domain-containing protein [Clostridia bacterium]